ncbi:hypothetical protein TeGR_g9880 [Tetraparma gracilis]|uniref:Uncharacterized protein n=1 Tax=Tetraparma gracilis TaxID=2962635 RepID=A0ABQ6MFW9_9STRA|nr:hypothetical protein TeGR_g9880 [Tetraparma gracilis]
MSSPMSKQSQILSIFSLHPASNNDCSTSFPKDLSNKFLNPRDLGMEWKLSMSSATRTVSSVSFSQLGGAGYLCLRPPPPCRSAGSRSSAVNTHSGSGSSGSGSIGSIGSIGSSGSGTM